MFDKKSQDRNGKLECFTLVLILKKKEGCCSSRSLMMDVVGENNKKHLNLSSSSSAAEAEAEAQGTSRSDFVLQWGNRKRLRCMKIQLKTDSAARPSATTTNTTTFRLPPPPPPPPHRISRNPESMKEEKVNPNNTSEKGGSSSGGERVEVWLPKLVISLTNKEKEEDFMAIKGSKLPQRPKKRPKYLQRTLNLVSPGSWLCDLTLERYEVREKKTSNKRPRGLKAMGNMDTDSD